jgi:hypothetical protein
VFGAEALLAAAPDYWVEDTPALLRLCLHGEGRHVRSGGAAGPARA